MCYFGPMRLIALVFFCMLMVRCQPTKPLTGSEKERILLEIVFSSEEAIKLVPYKLSNLNLILTNSLNGVDRGYSATILVNPDYVDSILKKLRIQDGIQEVKVIVN